MSFFGRGRAFAAVVAVAAFGASSGSAIAAESIGFGPKSLVSTELAGGEPLVFADTKHGTLIYTSHEGTTHLYRNGIASLPTAWLTAYRDQVNTWYSTDNGKTWKLSDLAGAGTNATGFNARPDQNLGFSDPDLTQDEGGRVYNTGIDLANDAIFSSNDGGKTWDKGTAYCHEGDRPWLAGAQADMVWVTTNTTAGQGTHKLYVSTDGGNTCNGTPQPGGTTDAGIPDSGTSPYGGGYSGNGKLLWNPKTQEIVEPITSQKGGGTNVGVGRYKPTSAAAGFTPGRWAYKGDIFAHWPSIALDKDGTLYAVWDTAPSGIKDTGKGCGTDTRTTPSNKVQYAYSTDDGDHWSTPVTLAAPTGSLVFWPWVVAGAAGHINVVWYESDRAVDIDCAPVSLTIKSTTLVNADHPNPPFNVVDASGGPIHYGTVCQGGTTCMATGQDRRLGDFFTNAPDANGCVMIASGDTTSWDDLTHSSMMYALPIIIRQKSGPSLYTKPDGDPIDCANPTG